MPGPGEGIKGGGATGVGAAGDAVPAVASGGVPPTTGGVVPGPNAFSLAKLKAIRGIWEPATGDQVPVPGSYVPYGYDPLAYERPIEYGMLIGGYGVGSERERHVWLSDIVPYARGELGGKAVLNPLLRGVHPSKFVLPVNGVPLLAFQMMNMLQAGQKWVSIVGTPDSKPVFDAFLKVFNPEIQAAGITFHFEPDRSGVALNLSNILTERQPAKVVVVGRADIEGSVLRFLTSHSGAISSSGLDFSFFSDPQAAITHASEQVGKGAKEVIFVGSDKLAPRVEGMRDAMSTIHPDLNIQHYRLSPNSEAVLGGMQKILNSRKPAKVAVVNYEEARGDFDGFMTEHGERARDQGVDIKYFSDSKQAIAWATEGLTNNGHQVIILGDKRIQGEVAELRRINPQYKDIITFRRFGGMTDNLAAAMRSLPRGKGPKVVWGQSDTPFIDVRRLASSPDRWVGDYVLGANVRGSMYHNSFKNYHFIARDRDGGSHPGKEGNVYSLNSDIRRTPFGPLEALFASRKSFGKAAGSRGGLVAGLLLGIRNPVSGQWQLPPLLNPSVLGDATVFVGAGLARSAPFLWRRYVSKTAWRGLPVPRFSLHQETGENLFYHVLGLNPSLSYGMGHTDPGGVLDIDGFNDYALAQYAMATAEDPSRIYPYWNLLRRFAESPDGMKAVETTNPQLTQAAIAQRFNDFYLRLYHTLQVSFKFVPVAPEKTGHSKGRVLLPQAMDAFLARPGLGGEHSTHVFVVAPTSYRADVNKFVEDNAARAATQKVTFHYVTDAWEALHEAQRLIDGGQVREADNTLYFLGEVRRRHVAKKLGFTVEEGPLVDVAEELGQKRVQDIAGIEANKLKAAAVDPELLPYLADGTLNSALLQRIYPGDQLKYLALAHEAHHHRREHAQGLFGNFKAARESTQPIVAREHLGDRNAYSAAVVEKYDVEVLQLAYRTLGIYPDFAQSQIIGWDFGQLKIHLLETMKGQTEYGKLMAESGKLAKAAKQLEAKAQKIARAKPEQSKRLLARSHQLTARSAQVAEKAQAHKPAHDKLLADSELAITQALTNNEDSPLRRIFLGLKACEVIRRSPENLSPTESRELYPKLKYNMVAGAEAAKVLGKVGKPLAAHFRHNLVQLDRAYVRKTGEALPVVTIKPNEGRLASSSPAPIRTDNRGFRIVPLPVPDAEVEAGATTQRTAFEDTRRATQSIIQDEDRHAARDEAPNLINRGHLEYRYAAQRLWREPALDHLFRTVSAEIGTISHAGWNLTALNEKIRTSAKATPALVPFEAQVADLADFNSQRDTPYRRLTSGMVAADYVRGDWQQIGPAELRVLYPELKYHLMNAHEVAGLCGEENDRKALKDYFAGQIRALDERYKLAVKETPPEFDYDFQENRLSNVRGGARIKEVAHRTTNVVQDSPYYLPTDVAAFARNIGIMESRIPHLLARAANVQNERELAKIVNQRMTLERLNLWVQSDDGQTWLNSEAAAPLRDNFKNRVMDLGPGLAVSILSMIPLEYLADILGLDPSLNREERFLLLVTAGHYIGRAAQGTWAVYTNRKILGAPFDFVTRSNTIELTHRPFQYTFQARRTMGHAISASVTRNFGFEGPGTARALGYTRYLGRTAAKTVLETVKVPGRTFWNMGPGLASSAGFDYLFGDGLGEPGSKARERFRFISFWAPEMHQMIFGNRGTYLFRTKVARVGARAFAGLFFADMGWHLYQRVVNGGEASEYALLVNAEAQSLKNKMEERSKLAMAGQGLMPTVSAYLDVGDDDDTYRQKVLANHDKACQEVKEALVAKLKLDVLMGEPGDMNQPKFYQQVTLGGLLSQGRLSGLEERVQLYLQGNPPQEAEAPDALVTRVINAFPHDQLSVSATMTLLAKVELAHLQEGVKSVYGILRPENEALRKLFDKNGKLREGHEGELLALVMGKPDAQAAEAEILKVRKTALVMRLLAARDAQTGLSPRLLALGQQVGVLDAKGEFIEDGHVNSVIAFYQQSKLQGILAKAFRT